MAEPKIMGPKVMGWCPGALRPMMSGDGLVVRIRARGGRLTSAELKGIAKASAMLGNGIIDLSARANFQIRGVHPDDHPALIADLSALGLIDRDAETETRRNILVTPFWHGGDGIAGLAAALANALAANDAPDLPAKFGFAVDGGASGACLRASSADIRLELTTEGVFIHADGARRGGLFSADDVADAALALAEWFLTSGGAPEGRGRMAPHLARGAVPPAEFLTHDLPASAAAPTGPGQVPDLGRLIALEFGQISAETLMALADQAPALRLTPWRMVLSEGDHPPDLPGLIHDPASPLLQVTACTGSPGCLQAHQETRTLARALAPHVTQALHVSGCAKGCAHPGTSPLTLTATPQGFDLALNAKAGESPLAISLPPDALTITESLTRHAAYL